MLKKCCVLLGRFLHSASVVVLVWISEAAAVMGFCVLLPFILKMQDFFSVVFYTFSAKNMYFYFIYFLCILTLCLYQRQSL